MFTFQTRFSNLMTNEFVIVRKNQNSVMWHNIRTIEPLCGFVLFEARIFKYGTFNRGVKKSKILAQYLQNYVYYAKSL